MIGVNGISLPVGYESIFINYGLSPLKDIFKFNGMFSNHIYSHHDHIYAAIVLIFLLLVISTFFPNTKQLMRNHDKSIFETYKGEMNSSLHILVEWNVTTIWALITSATLLLSIILLSGESEFIYFRF